MTKIIAQPNPKFTLNVSEKEQALARQAKKEFKTLIKDLDDHLKLLFDLKDAIVKEHPSQDVLQKKYRGRLLRYRRKIQKTFNEFLLKLKANIESLSPISDPEMIKLREIIISEFDELSDGIEAFMTLLNESDKDDFTQKMERLTSQISNRQNSIREVIDNQFIGHIDSDILGRKKISSLTFEIRKRIRLLRKYNRE